MPPSDVPQATPPQGPISEIAEQLSSANNVLITVSNDPSVDQLAACIGLTVALNKKDKHATAVFSGKVPSTIDFLEPDKTIEKDTNSLRDFIISLDKSKADKLRYKVEDEVVKIFITPYKTSISDADLEFSQGDFNVDAVVAIGVHNRSELDAAIVAHGRILHDAIIISINNAGTGDLGTLNWLDGGSSSLSEMVADLVQSIDDTVLDSQIATAFLTGIVAETDRFKNEKASPHTMSVAGAMMAAGASSQLVSTKLERSVKVPHDEIPEVTKDEEGSADTQADEAPAPPKPDDGTIEIDHSDEIHIDEHGKFAQVSDMLREMDEQAELDRQDADKAAAELMTPPDQLPGEPQTGEPTQPLSGPSMVYEPPTFGGQLTANTDKVDQQYASSPDPLTAQVNNGPTLTHAGSSEPVQPSAPPVEEAPASVPVIDEHQTLSDLEKSIHSPHADEYIETPVPPLPSSGAVDDVPPPPEPDYARDAVQRAVQASADYRPEPLQSIGSNPVGLDLGHTDKSQNSNDSKGGAGTPPPPVPPPLPPSS